MNDDAPFYIVRLTPESDAQESLDLAVPKDCVALPSAGLPADAGLFAPLALFVSTAERTLQVSIHDSVLPREISAGDLAEVDAGYRDATLIERRDLSTHEAEIITSFTQAGQPWVGRSKVIISGNRVFRAEAAAPRDCDPSTAEDCAKAVLSFKLPKADNTSSAEPLSDWEFRTPAPGGGFYYPASWSIAVDSTHGNSASCILENIAESECVGRINVIVRSTSTNATPSQCVQEFAAELMDTGIILSGAPLVPTEPPPGFAAASVYLPRAQEHGQERAAGAILLEHPTVIALIGIWGRGKKDSPLWWAINKRAFEIVRDSLRVEPA
ncbi:MAG: hypothetical protein H6821_00685 [Planctomycetaceae bacterium]|nr:hypothetical protein [Planctomycetaceae bacterium]MCB9926151.1 hypothetical protein [Planctomycetaceae bacterium]